MTIKHKYFILNTYDIMVFKIGSIGNEVKQIQFALGLNADGIFGKQTENAVIEFQKKHGLFPDGIVGKKTLDILNIKKIEVWLVKLGAYYTVKVKVNLNKNYKKAEFNWNEMYLHGLGLLVTNINDNNINYYIELFSKNELFYVYPIKK